MSQAVTIQPVITNADYKTALHRIEFLMDLNIPSKDEDVEMDILATLVEKYEDEHFPIGLPDPIDAIKFMMEQCGMSQNDLGKILGSKQRASEYLNRKIPLSFQAVRKIQDALKIPAEILIQEYKTAK